MLSVERCREILGADNEEVSDKEIERLQVLIRSFVNIILDEELSEVHS